VAIEPPPDLIKSMRTFAGMLGYELNKKGTAYQHKRLLQESNLLKLVKPSARAQFIDCLPLSKSQLLQDLFVLSELDFKRNGYFVEFGATNGISLSNSYLLETEFDWKGIVAEPARQWHEALKDNRSVHVETRCIWHSSGEQLIFNEAVKAEFSTIESFTHHDHQGQLRVDGKKYSVETVSLLDVLDAYGAPETIDYLSIDTEGSEFQILSAFDFSRYRFRVITCEHNFTSMREQLFELLSGHGYVRKHQQISKFDDWYVSVEAD